jgi:hypothetical protein
MGLIVILSTWCAEEVFQSERAKSDGVLGVGNIITHILISCVIINL